MTKTIALYTAGTGAVHSVPSWGCNCGVCSRARIQPQFARSPCSAVLKISDGEKPQYILIDAGQTDIMQRYNRCDIWAFVLTSLSRRSCTRVAPHKVAWTYKNPCILCT